MAGQVNGSSSGKSSGRMASVLGDIQFWVPVIVLIGGLLLLHSLR
jgi:hypothetical protein